MLNLGAPEIMVVLLVALIVLGPQRLPQAGKQVGRAIAEFRRVTSGVQQEIKEALDVSEFKEAFDVSEFKSAFDATELRDAFDLSKPSLPAASPAGTATVGTATAGAAIDGTGAAAGALAATDAGGVASATAVGAPTAVPTDTAVGADVPAPDGSTLFASPAFAAGPFDRVPVPTERRDVLLG